MSLCSTDQHCDWSDTVSELPRHEAKPPVVLTSSPYRPPARPATQARPLRCSQCGGCAGIFQHWHQSTAGYGICRSCLSDLSQHHCAHEIAARFGVEGVHYAAR